MLELRTLGMTGCAACILLFSLDGWAQSDAPSPNRTPVVAPIEQTPPDVPTTQLLQVTGRLSLRVEQLDVAVRELESRIASIGGRLASRHDASLSFSVPRDRFDEAMGLVARQGFERNRSVEVQDRTPEYLEVLALLRSAEQTRNRIAGLHKGIGGVKDPLRVEGTLTQWDARVAELARRRREILQHTSGALLHVELQPTVATTPEQVPTFRLPFPWLDELALTRLMDLQQPDPDEPETGGVESGAEIDMKLRVLRATDEQLLGGNETAAAAGISMRGVGETTPIGFAAGTDMALGGGFSGGFLYELRMLGGVGTGISDFLTFGVVTGLGFDGLTGGHIPFGVDFPVEAFLALEGGDLFRLGTWARTSWILASDDRQDGSENAPFGDELSTGVTLLLGDAHGTHNRDRPGLSLQGAYHELMGTHAYEASVGFGVSFLELEGVY